MKEMRVAREIILKLKELKADIRILGNQEMDIRESGHQGEQKRI